LMEKLKLEFLQFIFKLFFQRNFDIVI